MSVKVFVEGGGNRTLDTDCRREFSSFLKKAGVKMLPRIVPCGGRTSAYGDFSNKRNENDLLLVDSEGPVTAAGPWQHLNARDGWSRPAGVTDSQCHLMVQAMESWFLADREAVRAYYGQGFRGNALPANPHIEQIPKQDVDTGLQSATRDTTKGSYNKGRDSFEILATPRPRRRLSSASPYAKTIY